MIVTAQKPLSAIIDRLKSHARIFVVGCGECSATCKTGGKEQVEALCQELIKAGKTVVGSCIPDAPCIAAKTKSEFAKNMPALRQAQAMVVLACGLGAQSVKDNDRMGLDVIPGCDTLAGAVMDAQGNLTEKCSMCGECVLDVTFGVCPVTLCPKGLLNGPCGGMNKGKCEVNAERDCAWVLIFKEAEKRKAVEALKRINGPKNFKKAVKPRTVTMVK